MVGEQKPGPDGRFEVKRGILDLFLRGNDRLRVDRPWAVQVFRAGDAERALHRSAEEHQVFGARFNDVPRAGRIRVIGSRFGAERNHLRLFDPRAVQRPASSLQSLIGKHGNPIGGRGGVGRSEVEHVPLLSVEDHPRRRGRGRVHFARFAEIEDRALFRPGLQVPAGRQACQPALGACAVVEEVKNTSLLKDDRFAGSEHVAAAGTVPVPEHHSLVLCLHPQGRRRPSVGIGGFNRRHRRAACQQKESEHHSPCHVAAVNTGIPSPRRRKRPGFRPVCRRNGRTPNRYIRRRTPLSRTVRESCSGCPRTNRGSGC